MLGKDENTCRLYAVGSLNGIAYQHELIAVEHHKIDDQYKRETSLPEYEVCFGEGIYNC
jgi:hypothetical protein